MSEVWQCGRCKAAAHLNHVKATLGIRDQIVFDAADRFGVGVATSMGGGYASNIEDIVDIHLRTVETALGL